MVKGVIFDFNGVIIDDYPIQKIAWNHLSHLLRKRGVTDQEMLENIRGVPTKNVILRMANSSITQERLNELAKEKEEMVRKLYAKSSSFCLNKGLAKFLDKLKSNNMPRNKANPHLILI